MQRQLYYSDNLPVLQTLPDASVDLIYLDPPFNSKKAYNIIWPDELGQVQAFDDTWAWTPLCDQHLVELQHHPWAVKQGVTALLAALVAALGKNQICAYLVNMTVRLIELHRLLKPTGSLYLHCDPTASHYLKIVLDSIFGQQHFRNEIVWKRSGGFKRKTAKKFPQKNDILLFYSRSADQKSTFHTQYRPHKPEYLGRFKPDAKGRLYRDDVNPTKGGSRIIYLDETEGDIIDSVWIDIHPVNPVAKERLGYPTQKPIELLERILLASSNEGDVILDPFCGCGTSVAAAEKLKRHWIGIDITYSAIAAIRERFRRDRVDIWQEIELFNAPSTVTEVDEKLLNQASPLFARKEFEKFCVTTIGGLPNDKMGADGGIDGRIPLMSVPERAICSVKSGQVGVAQLNALNGLIRHDPADVAGVFISRHAPTQPMREFANKAGLHTPKQLDLLGPAIDPFPRLQILTLEQILNGKRPNLPYAKAA